MKSLYLNVRLKARFQNGCMFMHTGKHYSATFSSLREVKLKNKNTGEGGVTRNSRHTQNKSLFYVSSFTKQFEDESTNRTVLRVHVKHSQINSESSHSTSR